MSDPAIRPAEQGDRQAIYDVEQRAFARVDEADLVERLVEEGDTVLELVAVKDGTVAGHVLFSRLYVENAGERFPALALAPVAVVPELQGKGVGRALIEAAHDRLRKAGELLSVVLGEPAYYGRFGYDHARAAGATLLSGLELGPGGSSLYRVEDLEGHRWMFMQEDG